MKNTFIVALLAALLSSIITITIYQFAGFGQSGIVMQEVDSQNTSAALLHQLAKEGKIDELNLAPNFIGAAEKTTPTVVHIIATQEQRRTTRNNTPDLFREFFGEDFGFRSIPRGPRKSQSSGSGVIVSADGYIVTNNHVVNNASEIEVVLNDKRSYRASVIGTAPSTDLAVIKIAEESLPFIVLGNSDEVSIGEWVLAVGNPFNLESTVTAGIVSAKGRSLNILRDQSRTPIEAFIQTDAAVNPGNSGGALINTNGELIGINTAIATPTGTYAGYSFAVPVNIVKKVMNDLIEFGSIQRGFLGVSIANVDGKLAQEEGLKVNEGVLVTDVAARSAAKKAGIQAGDVIIAIDEREVKSVPELLEEIAKRSPGDAIQVKVNRDGKNTNIKVVLQDEQGSQATPQETANNKKISREIGAEIANLTAQEKEEQGLEHGVKVIRILNGKIKNNTDMQEGFIITKLGGKPVQSVDDFLNRIKDTKDGVFITGVYPNLDGEYYYAFGM